MRYFIIFFVLTLLACQPRYVSDVNGLMLPPETLNKQNEIAMEAKAYDFILGDWIRIDEKEGLTTYESWSKVHDLKYKGHSYTMQGDAIVWEEKTTLEIDAFKTQFVVKMDGQSKTTFLCKLTGEEAFECRNSKNDYPKLIKYWSEGDQLKAQISEGGPVVDFIFEKKRS